MDNVFSTLPDGYSTKSLRHNANLNFAFVDGHAKLIHMMSGEYSGYGLTARPTSEIDGLKWCADRNIVPGPTFSGSGYPVSSATETCAHAVQEFYSGKWVQNS